MSELDLIMKLILALVFGGVLGYLREREKKAAGFKTHILVCLGSTLFTLISVFCAKEFPGESAGRIAASVVTGIGFIGAGTILQAGKSIIGITTAASIWTVAAIGMALGFGYYSGAFYVTVLSIVVLTALNVFQRKFINSESEE